MTEPNVVQFPKSKIVRETIPDIEELNKVREKGIRNFADTLVADISSNILGDLDNYGINIDNDSFLKDFHFLVATMSAAVYRTLEVDHPLHKFMDENVVMIPMDNPEAEITEEMVDDFLKKIEDNLDLTD
jgi:hypothetical protein